MRPKKVPGIIRETEAALKHREGYKGGFRPNARSVLKKRPKYGEEKQE